MANASCRAGVPLPKLPKYKTRPNSKRRSRAEPRVPTADRHGEDSAMRSSNPVPGIIERERTTRKHGSGKRLYNVAVIRSAVEINHLTASIASTHAPTALIKQCSNDGRVGANRGRRSVRYRQPTRPQETKRCDHSRGTSPPTAHFPHESRPRKKKPSKMLGLYRGGGLRVKPSSGSHFDCCDRPNNHRRQQRHRQPHYRNRKPKRRYPHPLHRRPERRWWRQET